MNIKFNEVTWYSRFLAIVIIFGALPLLVFFIGREYEKTMSALNQENIAALSYSASDNSGHFYSHQEAGYSADKQNPSGIKGVALIGSSSASCTNDTSLTSDGLAGNYCTKTFRVLLSFINKKDQITGTTTTTIGGAFSVDLPAGIYSVKASGENMKPISLTKKYTVSPNKYTIVTLDFGSSIR